MADAWFKHDLYSHQRAKSATLDMNPLFETVLMYPPKQDDLFDLMNSLVPSTTSSYTLRSRDDNFTDRKFVGRGGKEDLINVLIEDYRNGDLDSSNYTLVYTVPATHTTAL